MTLHFKYILLFCCIVLLHGKKKEKRDLSDLKDDPVLSSLFESDVKETRKDRSTTFKDELLAAQKDKSKHDQLNSILFPNKLEQRRETDPLSELMNMNKQTPESYLWSLNSNKDISNDNGNTNERLKEVAKQLASGQTNGNNMETLQSAVNPALFQSNYVPLPGEGDPPQIVPEARRSYIPMYPIFNQYLWQRNDYPDVRQFMTNNARSYIPITPYTINTRLKDIPQDIPHFTIVSKKNTIPQVRPASMQSQEVSKSKQQKNIEYKKSLIPLPLNPSITNSAPSKTSYPVQLRVNSPNEKLRGIVPHVPEYGETVESIRRVQQALNYRKSFIPQQPQIAPNPTINPKSKKSAIPKKTAHNKKQQSSKKSKTPQNKGKISGGKTGTKEQRQFIPSPPVQQFVTQQQYIPSYIANYQQQSPFSMQQSVVQPYIAPPNAAQVQNMDGLHTRPIITAEECADQYATCGDFAKNNYCTDYPELMKIQCRKSCGHCVPSQTQSPVNQPATQQQQVAPAAVQTAQQLAPIATPAVTVQNETAVKGGETKALLNTTSQSDDSVGSGEADAGSGSGGDNPNEQTAPSSLKRSKEVSSALEGSESGSGRIADTDAESGAESGSAMSESSRFEGTPSTENAKKMPELNGAKRSKIEKPKIVTKIVPKAGFGEFSLPTKKSVIPTLTNQINDDDDSGSGSGSGTESGDESGAESGDTGAEKKSVTPASQVIPVHAKPTQKKSIPKKPSLPGAYPKIDLRAIASALAHYEEAALELAGEYPKPGSVDLTEYTRSFIPHPVDKAQENLNKYKQNLQVAKILTDERAKKADVPKYLKLSKDAYRKDETDEKPSTDADNLDSVRQRFIIPGVEPTLNDYYAETGKMNPFQKKHTNSKKSKIEASTIAQDPYEYIRNMPSGASMEPIVDPKARSTIPSDHSYPIFLMKVSPGEKKYVEEPATRRGKIRKLNAEGLPIFEDEKKPVAVPNPPPAPQHNFAAPKVETAPAPAQPSNYFMHPQPPLFMQVAPPPPRPAQETVAFQPSWENNVEQITAPNPSALFAHEETVQPEKQPGTNFLRSKMLNAFFSMKNNDAAEDEGSGGGGSGDGVRRGQIHEQIEGSGGGETGTKKTISLHNLLFNENGDESKEISVASGKTANQRKVQQDPSATYLQSNLAALTPENGNPNFEVQSGLTSGRLGAQFTMNKMSKTQETNWVRPNAESELASAMPESSSTAVETSRGDNLEDIGDEDDDRNDNSMEGDDEEVERSNVGGRQRIDNFWDYTTENDEEINKDTSSNRREYSSQKVNSQRNNHLNTDPKQFRKKELVNENKLELPNKTENTPKLGHFSRFSTHKKTIGLYKSEESNPQLLKSSKYQHRLHNNINSNRNPSKQTEKPEFTIDDMPPLTDLVKSNVKSRKLHSNQPTTLSQTSEHGYDISKKHYVSLDLDERNKNDQASNGKFQNEIVSNFQGDQMYFRKKHPKSHLRDYDENTVDDTAGKPSVFKISLSETDTSLKSKRRNAMSSTSEKPKLEAIKNMDSTHQGIKSSSAKSDYGNADDKDFYRDGFDKSIEQKQYEENKRDTYDEYDESDGDDDEDDDEEST